MAAAMLRGAGIASSDWPYKPAGVLLVIAHPDDESMFFAPSLLNLRQHNVPLHVVCMSNGGADGLGPTRELELYEACRLLGIPKGSVWVVDDPELQDGMQTDWPAAAVGRCVRQALQRLSGCDTLLTFDGQGVSGHINHRAVHRGVRQLLAQQQQQQTGPGLGLRAAWQLVSDPLWLKFTGLLGVAHAALARGAAGHQQLLLISPDPWRGVQAMQAHRSQWVWYRKLFVALSTYTYCNKLAVLA